MSGIVKRRVRKHYFHSDTRPFEDEDMSWKAKGILAYLFSRPPEWTVRMGDLRKRSTDGKTALRSGIKEIIECGYGKYVRERNEETGELEGQTLIVREALDLPWEDDSNGAETQETRDAENPNIGDPDPRESGTRSNETGSVKKQNGSNERCCSKRAESENSTSFEASSSNDAAQRNSNHAESGNHDLSFLPEKDRTNHLDDIRHVLAQLDGENAGQSGNGRATGLDRLKKLTLGGKSVMNALQRRAMLGFFNEHGWAKTVAACTIAGKKEMPPSALGKIAEQWQTQTSDQYDGMTDFSAMVRQWDSEGGDHAES